MMPSRMPNLASRRLTATVLLVLVVGLAGCSPSEPAMVSEPAPSPASRGTIVFDMGHGEIFSADDTTELGQSNAVARMQEAGFEVTVNRDQITAEDLGTASGLVIAGPMRPLLAEEYAVITDFLTRGGTVLLTIHVPFPVEKVPAHWGLPVGTEIMLSKRPLASAAEPSIFAADVITESTLTEGVKRIAVLSGWPVSSATDDAKLVVKTGEDTWLAATGDKSPAPDSDTVFESHGVIGATRVGSGVVVVSGDDAIFSNLALPAEDNLRLLDNIIKLMSESTDV